jgi:NAD(P)-dependent dehydrogenase (short-subunit alcohol dehydrogenase family)
LLVFLQIFLRVLSKNKQSHKVAIRFYLLIKGVDMKKISKLPAQKQTHQPGVEKEMVPSPESHGERYKGSGKLQDKIAVITGGDSGIGKAAAIFFAKEGAHIAILYKEEEEDANTTRSLIEKEGRECLLFKADVREEEVCFECIKQIVRKWGRLDILVNNAAVQFPQEKIEDLSSEQLEDTFRTNIFSYFYMTKASMEHLREGSSIINTTSVTAYKGHPTLLDYASTKGAIVAFTRSLALALAEKGIRVNGVAPGPIWTPLIPASFDAKKVSEFGQNVPMKRPGQADEVAPCFVFLASSDSSYMTGQILHPNGGVIVNG